MRKQNAIVAALMIVAAAVLFVLLRDSSDDSPSKSKTQSSKTNSPGNGEGRENPESSPGFTIVVKGGKPVGGTKELDYVKGDRVHFTVSSDVGDEIHVHGYDISKEVAAGGSVSFSFPASIEGIYEVELEKRATALATLRVNPG